MEKQIREGRKRMGNGQPAPTILFDGVCNLCNGFVNFIIDRDPKGVLRFGSLQSEPAEELLEQVEPSTEIRSESLDSVILVEQNATYTRSTAILRAFSYLGLPWNLLYGLVLVPRNLRDWIYDRVASNRYEWFGRRQECRVPTPELESRFIDE